MADAAEPQPPPPPHASYLIVHNVSKKHNGACVTGAAGRAHHADAAARAVASAVGVLARCATAFGVAEARVCLLRHRHATACALR
jgi:hypothetical protein